MYVVVHHTIIDPETAFARGDNLLAGIGTPAGVRLLQFYPSQDQSSVTCLWETDSVDGLRGYIEETLGEASENAYFPVAADIARGLPQTTPA